MIYSFSILSPNIRVTPSRFFAGKSFTVTPSSHINRIVAGNHIIRKSVEFSVKYLVSATVTVPMIKAYMAKGTNNCKSVFLFKEDLQYLHSSEFHLEIRVVPYHGSLWLQTGHFISSLSVRNHEFFLTLLFPENYSSLGQVIGCHFD